MANKDSHTTFEKLRGRDNYYDWCFNVENLFILEGLWKAIEGTETDAGKLAKAKAKLGLLVESTNFNHVRGAATAKDAWEKLKKAYADSGLCRRVGLLKTLLTTTLEKCATVEEYIDQIMTSAQKLGAIGMAVSDEWVGTILLAGLPEKYSPMIMAIESSGKEISGDFIKIKLLQEISNKDCEASSEVALQVNKKSQKSNNRSVTCNFCKKPGHMAKNCYKKKSSNSGDHHDESRANKSQGRGLYMSFAMQKDLSDTDWYLDSGASGHFTKHKDWLSNITEVRETITVADNSKLTAEAKGDVYVSIVINGVISETVIRNVLYVPGMCTNLLSVVQITNDSKLVNFDSKGFTITNQKTGEIIAAGVRENNLYKLDVVKNSALLCNYETWHRRIGHCNSNILDKMNKGSVDGIKFSKSKSTDICEVCIQAKHAKSPFEPSSTSTSDILELLHSDLCGPIEVESLGGSRYFLTFLDDYSSKLFIYFLKTKDEVKVKFYDFKKTIERQTGKKIKIVRTDNGKEYCNKEFDKYLDGIIHQTTVPYNPEQNGKAERINRTIVEKARCLLFDGAFPKEFWAEAVSTAVYIYNRTSCRVLPDFKSPEEVFTNKKPSVKHLKIVGSSAMVHVPKQKRKKFDVKSVKHVFVGYCETSKAYRLYNPSTKKFIISRDVIFMEGEQYFRNHMLIPEVDIHKFCFYPLFDEEITVQEGVDVVADDVTESITDEENFLSADETEEVQDPVQQEIRRSERIAKQQCMKVESGDDPDTYQEAMNSADCEEWKKAIQAEYDSLISNGTWEFADLPKGRKALNSKWVLKKKYNQDGSIDRYKARLVAKGYSQKAGIDYTETFSPVIRYESVRLLIALAAKLDLDIFQMDAITAFLQGNLTEEIYLNQPEGFIQSRGKVLRLKKSIYGLKQSSRTWNKTLHDAFESFGLTQSKIDSCIHFKNSGEKKFIVATYVDDLLIFTNDESTLNSFKKQIFSRFRMKDLGDAKSFLGINLSRDREAGTIAIDQKKYITDLLSKFGMTDCNSASTPMDVNQKFRKPVPEEIIDVPYQELIGSLLFAARITRPDIMFAVNFLSKFNTCPGKDQWTAAKRILRYLKGSIDKKLMYSRDNQPDIEIVGYCDADFAADVEDRKSISGFVYMMSGGAVTWNSRKQQTVALSTTESEYMSISCAVQEEFWLKNLVEELLNSSISITLHVDNMSALQLAKNSSFHSRTKHIDVRHHYIREAMDKNLIQLKHIGTNDMIADILTKGLSKPKIDYLSSKMGLT